MCDNHSIFAWSLQYLIVSKTVIFGLTGVVRKMPPLPSICAFFTVIASPQVRLDDHSCPA
jgi:hypothetical protein